jgi:uncharacterized protein
MKMIDADAHVIETEDTWKFMDASQSQFRPVSLSGASDDRHVWRIDGKIFSTAKVNKAIPEASRDMRHVEARLRHMDELGVEIQVLYPTLFLQPLTNKPEIELALCRSYNRWLAGIWGRGEGRLRWAAVLPLMSMEETLVEAQFAEDHGACGLFTRGLEDDKLLGDPYFYPLYEEASRLNLPVCVHASTGNFDWVQLFRNESGFAKFKIPVLSAFHTIVYDGIPDKFPTLRFGFIEVRAQWIPYVITDLAERFERKHGKTLSKNMMREKRLYVACQTDDDLPYILKYSGEDNIVIGTDYGHVDSSSEIDAIQTLRLQGDIKTEDMDKILWDNPKALYNI